MGFPAHVSALRAAHKVNCPPKVPDLFGTGERLAEHDVFVEMERDEHVEELPVDGSSPEVVLQVVLSQDGDSQFDLSVDVLKRGRRGDG